MSITPVPASVSGILQQSAADGRMSKSEIKQLKVALEQSSLPDTEKQAILRLANKIREFSTGGLFSKGSLNPDEMAQLKAMEPELGDSECAREMLTLFDAHVQPEREFSLFRAIGDFFSHLFGGDSDDADDAAPAIDPQAAAPYTQSSNQTGSYQTAPLDPQGVSFPDRAPTNPGANPGANPAAAPASNPAYPYVPTPDPVAALPDYRPDYFTAAPPDAGKMYERSPHHDESKFVPAFAMTAFHESGSYRKPNDPYAVGAITRPTRRQDLGGKTYGSYQFESSVYADGSTAGRSKTSGSTLMRFVNWPGNPFGEQLRAAAQQHGIASPGFDQVWKQLAQDQNKVFGEAQQQFLLNDRTESVGRFMDRAQLSEAVRQDPRIVDLVMGTTNQVASLADGVAEFLAQKQASAGRKLSVEEVGVAITQYKKEHIGSWFRSSPEAQAGIRNRYNEEQSVFTA